MLIFKLLFPSKRLITPCKEQQQKQFTNISGNNQKSNGQNKISDIYNPHFQHPCNIIRLSASCKLKLVFITENGRWIEHSEKYNCLMSPLNLKVIKCVFLCCRGSSKVPKNLRAFSSQHVQYHIPLKAKHKLARLNSITKIWDLTIDPSLSFCSLYSALFFNTHRF